MNILIVDCLATGEEKRKFSRDFIGGGPKLIAGILNQLGIKELNIKLKERTKNLQQQTWYLDQMELVMVDHGDLIWDQTQNLKVDLEK